jgi:hypothetical protein
LVRPFIFGKSKKKYKKNLLACITWASIGSWITGQPWSRGPDMSLDGVARSRDAAQRSPKQKQPCSRFRSGRPGLSTPNRTPDAGAHSSHHEISSRCGRQHEQITHATHLSRSFHLHKKAAAGGHESNDSYISSRGHESSSLGRSPPGSPSRHRRASSGLRRRHHRRRRNDEPQRPRRTTGKPKNAVR